ncbi:DUF2713 family protein, partial [Escherichia coli]|uniref:DUF2713 family protein n=2 Tax=Escherichia coli TaxID=562 RepID=UPI00222FC355
ADRNRSHWSTSKTPSYTKSVSWQHHHILSKMRDAAPKLIDFAKSFDPNSKEKIKIYTGTSKLIYDLFGVKSEK